MILNSQSSALNRSNKELYKLSKIVITLTITRCLLRSRSWLTKREHFITIIANLMS